MGEQDGRIDENLAPAPSQWGPSAPEPRRRRRRSRPARSRSEPWTDAEGRGAQGLAPRAFKPEAERACRASFTHTTS